MPKTMYTPRSELVCGKLDALHEAIVAREEKYACELVEIIRRDCQRMEAKLIERKKEALHLKSQQTKQDETCSVVSSTTTFTSEQPAMETCDE